MTDNMFDTGDKVQLTSKSDPTVNGEYVVQDKYHTDSSANPHHTESDNKLYVGWAYHLDTIDSWVVETSLTKA